MQTGPAEAESMMSKDKDTLWSFIVKVENLELCEAVNFELSIGKVTFVAPSRLPSRRKRLLGDVPRISELRSSNLKPWFAHFFDDADAFAVIRWKGKAAAIQNELERKVSDGLAILSLSQLGFSKRRIGARPSIDRTGGARREALFLDCRSEAGWLPMKRVDKFSPLRLDAAWKAFHKSSFFPKLVRLYFDESLSRSWREELWRASVLVGESFASSEIPQSFLWNMIALELLLTSRDDKFSTELPKRAKALLGWATSWSMDEYETRIRECYEKRCNLVHRGQKNDITVEDLLFTDDLLWNLFENIAAHPKLFRSKEALVDFSKKVEAEHILGVRPRTRPKTMIFLSKSYSEEDFNSI